MGFENCHFVFKAFKVTLKERQWMISPRSIKSVETLNKPMLWQEFPLKLRDTGLAISRQPSINRQWHSDILTLPVHWNVQESFTMLSGRFSVKRHWWKSHSTYWYLIILCWHVARILRRQRVRWRWICRSTRPRVVFTCTLIWRVVGIIRRALQTRAKPRGHLEIAWTLGDGIWIWVVRILSRQVLKSNENII